MQADSRVNSWYEIPLFNLLLRATLIQHSYQHEIAVTTFIINITYICVCVCVCVCVCMCVMLWTFVSMHMLAW
jgi:hypothetical protein